MSKADLLAQGWPGPIVEEGDLTVQIAALRKALGTTPDGQSWILTVPRQGYRLVTGSSSAGGPEGPRRDQPVLAELPFRILGGETAYFADGMVEDIVTALSRFRSFVVLTSGASFAYRNRTGDVRHIAQDLGVRYVLQGSVRRAGDRPRITARLVEGSSGVQLSAVHFDGALADVFDFQDRITENVAMLVAPHIQMAEIERSRKAGQHCRLLAGGAQTARENVEAYTLLTQRSRWSRATPCSLPPPPWRSAIGTRWAGRRSAPTTRRRAPTSRAAASSARRGIRQ